MAHHESPHCFRKRSSYAIAVSFPTGRWRRGADDYVGGSLVAGIRRLFPARINSLRAPQFHHSATVKCGGLFYKSDIFVVTAIGRGISFPNDEANEVGGGSVDSQEKWSD